MRISFRGPFHNGQQIYAADGNYMTRDLTPYGPTISTWVYLPSSNTGTNWAAAVGVSGVGNSGLQPLVANTWTKLTFTPSPGMLEYSGEIVVIGQANSWNATGTNYLYIDDIEQGSGDWTNDTFGALRR